jgi:hypothetical protein
MDSTSLWFRLSQFMSKTSCKSFYVVPSSDISKCILALPSAVVCLSTPVDSNIGHYHALYYYLVNGKIKCDHFDSFGKLPDQYDTETIHPVNYYNRWQLQAPNELTCPYYSLYFLRERATGTSYRKLMSRLSSNVKHNDNFVKDYFDSTVHRLEKFGIKGRVSK